MNKFWIRAKIYKNTHYSQTFISIKIPWLVSLKTDAKSYFAMDLALERFRQQLRQRRRSAGFTQDKLAERAGLSKNYIGLLEHGHREPSLSSLFRLSQALSCSLDELSGQENKEGMIATEGRLMEDPPSTVPSPQKRLQQLTNLLATRRPTEVALITSILESCLRLAEER